MPDLPVQTSISLTVGQTGQDKAVLCRLKFLVQNCEKSVVVSDVNMPR